MTQNQVVLVTGAAKGIGRHIAGTFAQAGARLAINDIEPLGDTTEELKKLGSEALAVTADVRDEDQVRAMMEQVNAHFGQIDVLVNNAGIVTHFSWMPRWPRVRDMDKSFWDRVVDTNLGGTFLCTKHVLPYMERQRSGCIINLHGADDPKVMGVGACAYGVSKDAIRTFTVYVAEEEREFNIRVLILAPKAAIATEDTPATIREELVGPDVLGNAFVLAAQAGAELTGKVVTFRDGKLVVV